MAYNKDFFDRAGLAYPTDDWTWDEFVAISRKLTGGPAIKWSFGVIPSVSRQTVTAFAGSYTHSGPALWIREQHDGSHQLAGVAGGTVGR